MFYFSERSKKKLSECHIILQNIANETLKRSNIDFKISEGHRNKKKQDDAFRNGYSQLEYPQSKHNSQPSMAFDFDPVPVDFVQVSRYVEIIELMKEIANEKGYRIRSGMEWGDYRHIELVNTSNSKDEFLLLIKDLRKKINNIFDSIEKKIG